MNSTPKHYLDISLKQQLCQYWQDDAVVFSAAVSTGLNGAGEQENSGRTPRGWHTVRACIGANQPLNTVFRGRRPTGEIYTPELSQKFADKDWILTRIICLCGL